VSGAGDVSGLGGSGMSCEVKWKRRSESVGRDQVNAQCERSINAAGDLIFARGKISPVASGTGFVSLGGHDAGAHVSCA
jgi:hypothetical protein